MEEENVLILHGWEDDSTKGFIPELIKSLKGKGYFPIALNLPNTKTPEFDKWFNYVEKEIKNYQNKQLNIVGHSMGALLALKLTEKYKVNKLVLISPVGSKPSKEYFISVSKNLSKDELAIYKNYQDREIDAEKIKSNSKDIIFFFGKKDIWINQEIRDFYIKTFKDTAKFNILEDKAHMSESEGVKNLPFVEELFEQEHKDAVGTHDHKHKTIDEKKSGENKVEEKKDDLKEKQETKKDVKKEVKHPKKIEAFALGTSLPISTKHSKEISRFISGKNPEEALELLENAMAMKVAIPLRGEIPHRRGKIMSGRYPIKASGYFIRVLKSAIANASLHNVNIANSRIHAKADMASRPYKRFGSERFKRTDVKITIKEEHKLERKFVEQNEQNKVI